jgi:hypothetical protein
MNPKFDDIGAAILKGACNPDAEDLAVELGEFELGALLDDEVLKEVPVIKFVIACRKTWHAIRDQLFLRKVAGFFTGCPKFTAEEKETFVKEHLTEPKQSKKLGDALVLILDRLDDLGKPPMLAKVFAAFVRKKIDFGTFRRLAAAIDHGTVEDLTEFVKNAQTVEGLEQKRGSQKRALYTNLAGTGLVGLPNSTGTAVMTGVAYEISDLGKLFQQCLVEQA